MQQKLTRTLVVLGTAAALAVPAAALAKQGGNGNGKGHGPDRAAVKGPKARTVIFKGLVASVDGSLVTVDVKRGNSRGRKFAGQQLVLDLADARVSVRDVNGDGTRDAGDIAAGDRFVAQVKVPRGTAIDPESAIATRRFVDAGPVPPPDPDEGDEPESEPSDG